MAAERDGLRKRLQEAVAHPIDTFLLDMQVAPPHTVPLSLTRASKSRAAPKSLTAPYCQLEGELESVKRGAVVILESGFQVRVALDGYGNHEAEIAEMYQQELVKAQHTVEELTYALKHNIKVGISADNKLTGSIACT